MMTNQTGNRRFVFVITHTNVALYALSFWIQIGTLPYLTKKFDVNPVTFGNLQTTFAVVQLLGGPLFGRFGDIFGSRSALALAFTCAFCSYFLLGVANTVLIIFLSRLPSIFMHAMQGAQMVVTDLTSAQERSDKLGQLGISYGVGMVIGPMIGGWCVTYASEQMAAFVAALISLVSIVLVLSFIPANTKTPVDAKDHDSDSEEPQSTSKRSNKLIDVDLFLSLIWRNPLARYLLLIKTVSGIPIGVLHSMFSMVALNHFKLDADVNGYVLSYIGVLSMVTQGLLVGRLTKLGFGDWTLINGSVATLCVSYAALALFVDGIISFCIALMPMVVAGAVFSLVVQTMLTKTVPSEDTGSMLGISMAVHSLIRSISPTIGGYLFQYCGFKSFGVIGVVFNGLLFVYIALHNRHQ